MIKTISVLLNEFKDYKNPYDHIRLLVKEGSLIKLKRGLYETERTQILLPSLRFSIRLLMSPFNPPFLFMGSFPKEWWG
jgi:hypothetical protein